MAVQPAALYFGARISRPGGADPYQHAVDLEADHLIGSSMPKPGERIALVGENGQGKTILVKLLARLCDPTEGAIFRDGIDLREYSIEDLSKEIGIIFQDFVRYEISARENIGVGRIEEIGNELRVSEAARKSLADAVVAKLPKWSSPNVGAPI